MKFLLIFSCVVFFTSCGNNADKKENATDASATEADNPQVAKGLELVAKSDCFGCHKLTETSIGPPYSAVALKYKTINAENMDSMVVQIIRGGFGRWGTVPMTPHPTTSKEDAQSMVHYIMSIKP